MDSSLLLHRVRGALYVCRLRVTCEPCLCEFTSLSKKSVVDVNRSVPKILFRRYEVRHAPHLGPILRFAGVLVVAVVVFVVVAKSRCRLRRSARVVVHFVVGVGVDVGVVGFPSKGIPRFCEFAPNP